MKDLDDFDYEKGSFLPQYFACFGQAEVEIDNAGAALSILSDLFTNLTIYACFRGLNFCRKCLFLAGILNTLGMTLKNWSDSKFYSTLHPDHIKYVSPYLLRSS